MDGSRTPTPTVDGGHGGSSLICKQAAFHRDGGEVVSISTQRRAGDRVDRLSFNGVRTGDFAKNRFRHALFGPEDATAGAESELQVPVVGTSDCVDLLLALEASHVVKNLRKRADPGVVSVQDAITTVTSSQSHSLCAASS